MDDKQQLIEHTLPFCCHESNCSACCWLMWAPDKHCSVSLSSKDRSLMPLALCENQLMALSNSWPRRPHMQASSLAWPLIICLFSLEIAPADLTAPSCLQSSRWPFGLFEHGSDVLPGHRDTAAACPCSNRFLPANGLSRWARSR